MKNCDGGQFFMIRTDPKLVNNFFFCPRPPHISAIIVDLFHTHIALSEFSKLRLTECFKGEIYLFECWSNKNLF